MNDNLEIGKFTLESLTMGMYADPKIVYREYIQNAVDSLEECVSKKIIEKQHMRIEVLIDRENNNITISDNGMGLASSSSYKTLTDIGNSTKNHTVNRGFRGIGRLGGLSYCKRINFVTSYIGEAVKTTLSFDCEKLRELLTPGKYEGYDLKKVIEAITKFTSEKEEADCHYFNVELVDVQDFSDLLDIERVELYLSQVAPVSYYPRLFVWGSEIKSYTRKFDYEIAEFQIFIGEDKDNLKPIFKPNKHRFLSDRKKKISDEVKNIVTFEIKDDNNNLLAIGWYANTNWLGGILDDGLAGLKVRKGNMLIGDSNTMNSIFKEDRFNKWAQGEIFVLCEELIPNARRDDFEHNETYVRFMSKLKNNIGEEISAIIRENSKNRNDISGRIICEAEQEVTEAERMASTGYNSKTEKESITNDLKSTLEKIKGIKPQQEEFKLKKIEVEKKIVGILNKVEDDSNYKLKRVSSAIGRKEKKVLEIVSEILTRHITKPLLDLIIEDLINELNKNKI